MLQRLLEFSIHKNEGNYRLDRARSNWREDAAEAKQLDKALRDKIERLEEEQSELEEELVVLNDELSYIGGNEPEITSVSFDGWEQRNTLPEDQITEVEERIEDLEQQISELSSQLND